MGTDKKKLRREMRKGNIITFADLFNSGNKVKRTSKEVFSFVGCLVFGAGLLFLFYICYMLAYACM